MTILHQPTMASEQFNYCYKVPTLAHVYDTVSFGIAPCRPNKRGKCVKAGEAAVRIVLTTSRPDHPAMAERFARIIAEGLTRGAIYRGPKVIRLDSHENTNPADYLVDYLEEQVSE